MAVCWIMQKWDTWSWIRWTATVCDGDASILAGRTTRSTWAFWNLTSKFSPMEVRYLLGTNSVEHDELLNRLLIIFNYLLRVLWGRIYSHHHVYLLLPTRKYSTALWICDGESLQVKLDGVTGIPVLCFYKLFGYFVSIIGYLYMDLGTSLARWTWWCLRITYWCTCVAWPLAVRCLALNGSGNVTCPLTEGKSNKKTSIFVDIILFIKLIYY